MSNEKVTIEEGQEAALDRLGDVDKPQVEAATTGDFDARRHIEELTGEAEKMPASDLIQAVLVGGSAVADSRGLGHLAFSETESAIMGVAVGDVLDKYMPDFKASKEMALVLVSFTVIMPKYVAHLQYLKNAANDDEGGSDGSQSES